MTQKPISWQKRLWRKTKAIITLKRIRHTIWKVCTDCFTNWNGDFDPARLVYALILLYGLAFLWMSIWDTHVHHVFNQMGFATGASALAVQMIAAAAGVRLKQNAEAPFPNVPAVAPPPPAPDPGAGGDGDGDGSDGDGAPGPHAPR
ncbi:hypothetical protein [Paraburkholderia sp. BCC1886]|uniref:hypothetical protein n=1 Tax=Paraburkholderia sp. BCC1886 TaxID=2562670 RepID=UPI001182F41D|nr:hypothetical protein [Paraburkholderia sp. BCC1886]